MRNLRNKLSIILVLFFAFSVQVFAQIKKPTPAEKNGNVAAANFVNSFFKSYHQIFDLTKIRPIFLNKVFNYS